MKFFFSYLKPYRGLIAYILIVKFSGSMAELLIPYVLEYLIDDIAPTKNLTMVLIWGAIMLLLAVLVRVLNVMANRRTIGVAQKATYRMRRDLFDASIYLSGNQTDEFGLPSLTSRMTSDSYNFQNFIRAMLAMGIRAPVLLFGGIVVTLTMDLGLAAILCVLAPIVLDSIVYVSWKGVPMYERVQKKLDSVIRIMRENITGIRVVKALSKEQEEMGRFGISNDDLTRSERQAGLVMALPGPIMTFFLNMGLTLVVLVGAYRVDRGLAQPGVILAFLTYFNMILMGAMGLNRLFMMMSKANASSLRIQAVIEKQREPAPIPASEGAVPSGDGYIRFENVSFRYGRDSEKLAGFHGEKRRPALENISFAVPKGGSLGIIGATGSGKTSIINLLMRFYDPGEGYVFVDGRDVRTYVPQELRRKFGVVFQNDVVFADTLEENIRFGRDVDETGLARAAKDACAAEFIADLEDGMGHKADIRGSNFSGGQRQRILISRALAGNADILVLDDSSSALDYRTDAAVRSAIREHHADTTTIIVAQRVSSIMSLDEIIMLEGGRILGRGSHDELMECCPKYREIYRVQMGEEE